MMYLTPDAQQAMYDASFAVISYQTRVDLMSETPKEAVGGVFSSRSSRLMEQSTSVGVYDSLMSGARYIDNAGAGEYS